MNRLTQGVVLPGGGPWRGPGPGVDGGCDNERKSVVKIQLDRVIDAFVTEVGEQGLLGIDIHAICKRADVSLTAFYELFPREFDCALTAFSIGSRRVCDLGEAAFRRTSGTWEVRLHAAISDMFNLLASNSAFARLAVDMRWDTEGAEHFDAIVVRCRRSFGGTAPMAIPAGVECDADIYETVLIGGALGALSKAVLGGSVADLPALADTVTYFLTLPFVGPERALGVLRHN